MIWLAVIVFIVMLLVLVLVHEWGHYFAAKKAGCTVEEFGFGFPPRVASFVKNGTRWSFNLLPIGGFVKITGENMDQEDPGPDSFASKSATWRIIILAAGVVMNIVLAVVLLGIQSGIGAPTLVTDENAHLLTDHKTYILGVGEDTPAAEAELKEFDRIVSIGSVMDPTVDDVQTIVQERSGETLTLEIDRQGQRIDKEVLARANPPEGEGALGISLASTGLEKTAWWKTPWEGVKRTGQLTVAIVTQFGLLLQRLFSEGQVGEALSGPIAIAVYTNEATQMGLPYLLEFAALISINLAIINILPFPALDGGRILFVILEKILGRRVPGKIESVVHTAGFVFLIALMVLITFKDVQRYI
ncbi:MAG: RIP metalloprotease RseP [Candidatus Andersenbacteria bacterium]